MLNNLLKSPLVLYIVLYNVSYNMLYKQGLIPALVHAFRQMPDVQAMLEAKLPYVSDETFQKMNEAFAAFLKDLK